jgi:hypothetical protein
MANKKINQLVLKTTIQSTDLFPLGDASTGQLFKKTIAELQAAIGGAVISVNGLVGTVVLDTDDIQELATPTNKYFTDARARGAISLTVTGNSGASTYSNSTGVLNVPTYTLAGLGGITASFLSGASGIAYNSSTGVITYTGTVFTDASIRALVSAGAGLSYNSSTGVFSYSGTVYTDASIRALISLTTSGSSGASTYNNTTGVLNVPTYTLAGLGGISSTFLTAGTGISYSSSTGIISYSGTVYTDSSVRGLFSATAPITYNSSTGAIGITQASTSANGFLTSTDWNTFNGKQNALTLGNVTEVASNVLMFPDGGTNKTIGNLSIQVVQSGASTNGYLSSTDWTTFNNKQATITLTTTGTTGASTFSAGTLNIPQYQGAITLTTTGTSGAATFSSNTLNIPQYQTALTNPVTGTGTSGHVAYFNGSGSIAGDAGHFWDNTNKRLGIGTIAPSNFLHVNASGTETATFETSGTASGIRLKNTGGTASEWILQSEGGNSSAAFKIYSLTASAYRFSILGNGNVGIGTVSPNISGGASGSTALTISASESGRNGILELKGTRTSSGQISSYVRSFSNSATSPGVDLVFYRGAADTDGELAIATSGSDRMRITSGGEIIGTNNSQFRVTSSGNFRVNSNTDGLIGYFMRSGSWKGNSENNLALATDGAFGIAFFTNGSTSEKMLLTAGGNILMGTTTDNGERLYVSGSIRATGSITANSDVRLKKNIERIENALQKVSEISGYTYNTIYDEDRHAGVIAQEIDKVLPEIVNKGNDGLMGVEYGNISALLIEAIKDLKKDNESLRAIVEGLTK